MIEQNFMSKYCHSIFSCVPCHFGSFPVSCRSTYYQKMEFKRLEHLNMFPRESKKSSRNDFVFSHESQLKKQLTENKSNGKDKYIR